MDHTHDTPRRGRPPGARNQHPKTAGRATAPAGTSGHAELEAHTWAAFRARCDRWLSHRGIHPAAR